MAEGSARTRVIANRSCSSGVQEFRSSGVREFQEFRSARVRECRSSGVREFGGRGVQRWRTLRLRTVVDGPRACVVASKTAHRVGAERVVLVSLSDAMQKSLIKAQPRASRPARCIFSYSPSRRAASSLLVATDLDFVKSSVYQQNRVEIA